MQVRLKRWIVPLIVALLAVPALSACTAATNSIGKVTFNFETTAQYPGALQFHEVISPSDTGLMGFAWVNLCGGNDACFQKYADIELAAHANGTYLGPMYDAIGDCGPGVFPIFCDGSNQEGDNPQYFGSRDWALTIYTADDVGPGGCMKIAAVDDDYSNLLSILISGNTTPLQLTSVSYDWADHYGDHDEGWQAEPAGSEGC